jgi:hypothetical protein
MPPHWSGDENGAGQFGSVTRNAEVYPDSDRRCAVASNGSTGGQGHMPSEANDNVMPPGRSSPFDHDVKVDRHFVVERYDAGPLAGGRNPECAQS